MKNKIYIVIFLLVFTISKTVKSQNSALSAEFYGYLSTTSFSDRFQYKTLITDYATLSQYLNFRFLYHYEFSSRSEFGMGFYAGIEHTNYGLETGVEFNGVNFIESNKVLAIGTPVGIKFGSIEDESFQIDVYGGAGYFLNYFYKKSNIIADQEFEQYGFFRDEISKYNLFFEFGVHLFILDIRLRFLPSSIMNRKFTARNSINYRPFDEYPNGIFLLSIGIDGFSGRD
jgi:hypothetical protein